MNPHRKRLLLSCAVLVLAVSTVVSGAALAQQNSTNNPQDTTIQSSGQGLEITPPVVEIDADPGESVVVEIGVRNITSIDLIASGEANDFVAKNETGQPRILLGNEEKTLYPLAEYVANVPDLRIAPTEQEIIEVEINIPEDASPGGHFGVVRFSAQPADPSGEESAVTLSASVGALVLLNVSGEVEESMTVEELYVAKEGEKGRFFEKGPLTFVTRIANTGNTYTQPSGELVVTNIFGQESLKTPFNESESNVLPGSIRRFEQEAEGKDFWVGRYTLTTNLQYGSSGAALEESVNFWVIPYKPIAIIMLMIIVVGFFGRRALKAYKRNVVKKYQQQQGNEQSSGSDHNNPV